MVTICMKCQNLFSGKNKKNILKCLLLKLLPRVLSVHATFNKVYKCEIASWPKGSASKQEARGPWLAHLSETATADMHFLCNFFFNSVIATNERIII